MIHRRKKCGEEATGAVVAGPASGPLTSLSGKSPLLRQSLGSVHLERRWAAWPYQLLLLFR